VQLQAQTFLALSRSCTTACHAVSRQRPVTHSLLYMKIVTKKKIGRDDDFSNKD
jgi:hypothetical protein